jgi:hypothetical protein
VGEAEMDGDLAARVAPTTIDDGTFLSTDYFNAFNEVIMLLGMLQDMPEMFDEVRGWHFRTYEEHFRESGLGIAPLAIEAYGHVDPPVRAQFERNIDQLRLTVETARDALGALMDQGELEHFKHSAIDYTMQLQALVDAGSAIVHGGTTQVADQSAIDDMF